MASVNKWLGIGNLTKNPKTRYLPNGDAVCNITVACNEQWKDKGTGEKKESVEFVRVAFFRQLAEIAGKYLKKGAMVYVEGSLKTRKWQDKDGNDRYTTEITGSEMKMLGGKSDDRPSESRQAQTSAPKHQSGAGGGFDEMDDSIPF